MAQTPVTQDVSLAHRADVIAAVAGLLDAPGGGVAVVTGPRGSGRSSALDAVIGQAAAGTTVFRARGSAADRAVGHGVVTTLLGDLPGTGDTGDRATAAVRAEAANAPVLVVVDDADLADDASRAWLVSLPRRIDGLPVTLVLATGTGPTVAGDLRRAAPTQVLPLEPLCDACTVDLAARWWRGPLHEELAAALTTVAGGRPGAVRALVDALLAAGVDTGPFDAATIRAALARGLADSALAWVADGDPGAVDVLAGLVVLGDTGDLEAAAALTGLGAVAATAARPVLRAAGVLAADSDRPAHLLVAPAVEAVVGPARLAALHAAAAAAGRRTNRPATEIADHLLAGGGAADAAILRGAATLARSDADWDAAARYLRAALDTGADAQLGAALAEVDLHRDVWTAARTLTAAADPAPALLVSAADAGLAWLDGPVADLLGATAAGDDADVRLAAAALVSGAPGGTRRVLRSGAVRRAAPAAVIDLTVARAAALGLAGRRPATVAVVVDRVLRASAAGVGPSSRSLLTAAVCAMWLGRDAHAAHLVDLAAEAYRAADLTVGEAWVRVVRAELHRRSGALTAAAAEADAAADLAAEVGAGGLVLVAAAVAASAALDAGDPDTAAALLASGGDESPALPWLEAHVAVVHARLETAAGDPRAAANRLARVAAPFGGAVGPAALPWREVAVAAHLALGDLDTARDLAGDALTAARRWKAPAELGAAVAAVAATRQGGDVRLRAWADAVRLLDGAGRPAAAAAALAELGAVRRETGDVAGATTAEQRRRELLAAHPDLRPAVASDAARGPRSARTGRPLAAVDPAAQAPRLTAGERRVTDLVLQGLGNQAVADTLCLSKRTVDTHLGRIYRKLGIAGRPELADALIAIGEAPRPHGM